MNELTKQILLDLLEAAKAHIEAGEQSEAVEKIDSAIAVVENEGVESAVEDDPENPPLPGTGNNGVIP